MWALSHIVQVAGAAPPGSSPITKSPPPSHWVQEGEMGLEESPWGSVLEPGTRMQLQAVGSLPQAQLQSPRPSTVPGAHPHQAVSHPPGLPCLHHVLQLLPLEELCDSKDSIPGGLWNSRNWEMAPGPGKVDLG